MNSVMFEIEKDGRTIMIFATTKYDPCLLYELRNNVLKSDNYRQGNLCRNFEDKEWLPEDCD